MTEMRFPPATCRFAIAGLMLSCVGVAQSPHVLPAVIDAAATVEDKLGAAAALDTRFRGEDGDEVVLRDLLGSDRPVVLNLGYFGCPGMCGQVLNSLLAAMKDSELLPGRDFDLLTVSIDARERSDLARAKKDAYLAELGVATPELERGWRFLVGDEDQIHALTDSVGWRFQWSEHTAQFDHPSVIVLLSPEGVVTRYLGALGMSGRTFRRGVVEAGEGKVGSFIDRLLQTCLTFDPNTGTYTVAVTTVMQIGGALTVLALAGMLYSLWRRERSRPMPSLEVPTEVTS